jgi:hypothetical protein
MQNSPSLAYFPSASAIRACFHQATAAGGGKILDAFEKGDQLFLRARMPNVGGDVRPQDRIEGGVALRTKGSDVLVHPFVYRLVCRNGAIRAHAAGTWRISRADEAAPDRSEELILREVEAAVAACSSPVAFREGFFEMQSAAEIMEADFLLMVLPLLSTWHGEHVFPQIMESYKRAGDRNLFGFMNAITARARRIRAPETRWRLEELGGAVGALRPRSQPTRGRAAAPFVRV